MVNRNDVAKKRPSATWHYDVLYDLAAALRRDSMTRTAELVEDAMIVLAEESTMRHTVDADDLIGPRPSHFPTRATSRH